MARDGSKTGLEDHSTTTGVRLKLGSGIERTDQGLKSSDFIQDICWDTEMVGLELARSPFKNLDANTSSSDVGQVEALKDKAFMVLRGRHELWDVGEHGHGRNQGFWYPSLFMERSGLS